MAAREISQKHRWVEFVAASRFYRFFDYELSIFIACRAFRKGQQDGATPNGCNEVAAIILRRVFPIGSGSEK